MVSIARLGYYVRDLPVFGFSGMGGINLLLRKSTDEYAGKVTGLIPEDPLIEIEASQYSKEIIEGNDPASTRSQTLFDESSVKHGKPLRTFILSAARTGRYLYSAL